MDQLTLPELKLKDGDLFGAAVLTPAFASDLSTWTATIHKDGLLTQTVLVAQPPTFDEQIETLRQHVSEEQLAGLTQIVDEERLLNFSRFPHILMTDQQSTQLIIRLHGKTNVIDAYGPHAVAMLAETEEDKAKAERYCKLWNAIVELTPFTPYGR